MNGRFYDYQLARFLSPDPYVQDTTNPQNFNRYSYCLNNPLKYTDPTGEIAWLVPVILGTVAGAYSGGVIANNGSYNPIKWDYHRGKIWGYMFGGAVAGAASSYVGCAIAASGIPMASTAAIAGASFVNSIGTNMYTRGETPVSISIGVASYDFDNKKFGFLGKKGNSALENIGYSFGVLANVSYILAGLKPGNVELRTENDPNYNSNGTGKDLIGHSQLSDGNGNLLVELN